MRASSDTAVSTTTTEGSREAARGLTPAVRLPLTIAALLLALTVLLSAAAYTEIRRTALRFGADRLTSVNAQLAQLLAGSRSQMIERTQAFTRKPEVAAFVETPSAANRRAAARALYLSGYTDPGLVSKGLLEGDVHFLQKPFTSRALLRKVREVLDHASRDRR